MPARNRSPRRRRWIYSGNGLTARAKRHPASRSRGGGTGIHGPRAKSRTRAAHPYRTAACALPAGKSVFATPSRRSILPPMKLKLKGCARVGLLAFTLTVCTGCNGLIAERSISPLTFLLPGLMDQRPQVPVDSSSLTTNAVLTLAQAR